MNDSDFHFGPLAGNTMRLFSIFVLLFSAPTLYPSGKVLAETAKGSSEKPNKPFLLINEMRFVGQPDLDHLGFEDIRVVYAAEMWGRSKEYEQPDQKHLDKFIPSKIKPAKLICLDIEHWTLDSRMADKSVIDENVDKYIAILQKFKQYLPDTKFGYYSMIPLRDYHSPVKGKNVEAWKSANRRLEPIAEKVDVVFPSIYTFYKDQEGWLEYAIANIDEAKKYGKPVIPFVWPQYHSSSNFFAYDPIDKDYWRLQLETLYEHTDGLVIWSPGGKGRSDWDEDAGWWEATKEFIKEHKLDQANAQSPILQGFETH